MSNSTNLDLDLPMLGLAPSIEERGLYRNVHVKPIAGTAYGYSMIAPRSWYKLADAVGRDAVPSTERFAPLGIFSPFDPPLPPVTLSVGTRLVRDNKSVADLFMDHCSKEGFDVLAARPQLHAAGEVIEGLATQEAPPVGLVKMRMMMFEDGGRVFLLSGMAPASLYHEFLRDLSLAIITFELDFRQGGTLPLLPK